MKRQLISIGAAGALVMAAGLATAASNPGPAGQQAPSTSAPKADTPGQRVAKATPAAGQITLVGCVELESDYRKRMAAGRGGVLGTGAGAGDEFVITNVRPATTGVGTTGARDDTQTRQAQESSSGTGGGVYTVTGPQEKNLKRDVGRQVEVVGVLENAGKKSTGSELTDLSDLPRVRIDTWHPVADYCPGK